MPVAFVLIYEIKSVWLHILIRSYVRDYVRMYDNFDCTYSFQMLHYRQQSIFELNSCKCEVIHFYTFQNTLKLSLPLTYEQAEQTLSKSGKIASSFDSSVGVDNDHIATYKSETDEGVSDHGISDAVSESNVRINFCDLYDIHTITDIEFLHPISTNSLKPTKLQNSSCEAKRILPARMNVQVHLSNGLRQKHTIKLRQKEKCSRIQILKFLVRKRCIEKYLQ